MLDKTLNGSVFTPRPAVLIFNIYSFTNSRLFKEHYLKPEGFEKGGWFPEKYQKRPQKPAASPVATAATPGERRDFSEGTWFQERAFRRRERPRSASFPSFWDAEVENLLVGLIRSGSLPGHLPPRDKN